MKTLVYNGPRHVSMTGVEDARIERPTDVLVRVTHTGAAYGFADWGPWRGSPAEYLRVPWGDINSLLLPEDVHTSIVMVVDRHADRLRLAEGIGCIPIDDSKVPPVDQVLGLTRGAGADCVCEGVVGVFVPANPSCLVSRQLPITSAPDAYAYFDRRDTGWTKVVLSPREASGGSARQTAPVASRHIALGSPCH